MKLSFVIPVLNEEQSLDILYHEIIENSPYSDNEIIFIDDGSNDSSFDIMKNLAKKDDNIKVIKFRRNFGKAAALNVGFALATGDIIFTMDADLQDNPVEIKNFINKINEGYDLVSGWKAKRHDPISKRLPSKLFNAVTKAAFKVKLHDYNCGFKAYKNCVVKEIDVYGEMHRYIPALAAAKGFKIAEIPVNHRARKYGKSKYGLKRYTRGFWDLLTVKLVTAFNRSPLYFFGAIGGFFAFAGFAISLYLTVLKLFYSHSLSNRPLLFLGITLLLTGFQFFAVGLIGELLVNQTRKSNKHKNISISETIGCEKP